MKRKDGAEKKVLMVASVASMIDQFNMLNIRLLLDMGYRVHVACNFEEGNTCDSRQIRRLQKILDKMHVVWYQWDCPRGVHSIWKCCRAYEQLWVLTGRYHYEWIHCHSPIGGVLARLVAHKRGIRVIYTAHGFHFYHGAPVKNWLLYYPVEKLLAYWTDVLITVNREDYQFARKNLKADRICRISGVGIDVEKFSGKDLVYRSESKVWQENTDSEETKILQKGIFSEKEIGCSRKEFCRKYRIPEGAHILLSVGELTKRKNHRIVIDALSVWMEQDVYYIICGQGKLQKQLMHYAERKGVAKYVRITGFQENVLNMYQNADIFVFPSLQEGLPVALMEAMAAGLPCVVSDIRGNRELVADKAGGIRFCPQDIMQLQRALQTMLNNSQLQLACGRYNQFYVKKYAIQIVADQTRYIYENMKKNIRQTAESQMKQGHLDGKEIWQSKKEKPVRVLHVLKSSWFSGAENVAVTICRNLDVRYEIAYTSPKGSIEEYLRQNDISYRPITALHIWELQRVIHEYQPDIIHAHDFTAAVLCTIVKRNSFLIAHLHNDPPWIRRWTARALIFRIAERGIDRLLLVSECIRDEAVFLKNDGVSCTVVGNPVDAVRIRRMAQEYVSEIFDIVFAGRLVEQKNPEKFIRIIHRLHKTGIRVRAVMLGEGERSENCRKLIIQLGMTEWIVMKGFCGNPYPYMKQAKLLLMTSEWEGFGLVAAEALLLGTPVLASPVGGLCDILGSYPPAFCKSEGEFAQKTGRLLCDKRLYQRFCSEVGKKVHVEDLERYMYRIRKIYGEAML